MLDTKACLKDSDTIVEFQHVLEFLRGSIDRTLAAVSNYLNDVRTEIERHIELLEKTVEDAKSNVEQAEANKFSAYSCLSEAEAAMEVAYNELQEAIEYEEEMDLDFYDDDFDVDYYDYE